MGKRPSAGRPRTDETGDRADLRPPAGYLPGPALAWDQFSTQGLGGLLRLPSGSVVAYEDLARQVGSGRAAQAVGNALAHNPVAYLIPCHRVLRKAGDFGGYRYGALRKKAILGWEMAQTAPGSSPSHIPLSNIR